MSRLDSFIRRLTAQKQLLETVADRISGLDGCVLELGLGNGRTYSHLREILPERDIYVFDRDLACHPSCIPDSEHMIFGEIRETLAFCGPRIKAKAAFIHADLGSGDPTTDLATSSWLSPLINKHLEADGYVLSGLPLQLDGFNEFPMPDGIRPGRYYLYQKVSVEKAVNGSLEDVCAAGGSEGRRVGADLGGAMDRADARRSWG